MMNPDFESVERPRVVVLSGAGMSAESGLKTFRGAGGLWEGHRVEDVATPEAWERSPETVLRFYNERRRQLETVNPNAGHRALYELETSFRVHIVTQNVDNLHERAGSTDVLHLHGELTKARSTADENLIYKIGTKEIELGDTCERGSQLRPHIVWFGEDVPAIMDAAKIVELADILIVVGTSLSVYPAAGLVHYAGDACRCFLVDPHLSPTTDLTAFEVLEETAAQGLPILVDRLLEEGIQ